jgi:hypothetical protein
VAFFGKQSEYSILLRHVLYAPQKARVQRYKIPERYTAEFPAERGVHSCTAWCTISRLKGTSIPSASTGPVLRMPSRLCSVKDATISGLAALIFNPRKNFIHSLASPNKAINVDCGVAFVAKISQHFKARVSFRNIVPVPHPNFRRGLD